jgi:Cu+-exporting ATPase
MEAKPIKDPVCNMEVHLEKAIKLTHKGKDYYFCNTTCEWAFKENPDQFIKE